MKITLPSRQIVLYTLVVVSMVFSAAIGLLYTVTSNKVTNQASCVAEYNKLDGLARDERAKFAIKQTKADKRQVRSDIQTWTSLLHQFKDPSSLSDQQRAKRFFGTIQHQIDSLTLKLDSLTKTQHSRLQNPYPAPDSCKDGKITSKESGVVQ